MFGTHEEEITTTAEQFKKLDKAVAVSDPAKETFVSTKTAYKVQYNRIINENDNKILNPYIDVKSGEISQNMS